MHILLISGEFPPMQGGVGDYTREMARAFTAHGHEASIVIPALLAGAYREGSAEPWNVLPVTRDWRWGCWGEILSTIRRVEPDVIDIQYQAAAYDMRVPAIHVLPWRLRHAAGTPPIVVTCHDLKPPYLFPKAGPLRSWVVRCLACRSDAVVVTNAEDLAVAEQWPCLHGSQSPSVHQIPIGSNIPVLPPRGFDRTTWRAEHGYGEGDFVWAYFGFLNESKGGETLVRALARAPSNHALLMVGGRVGTSDVTNRAYAARFEEWMLDLGVIDRVQWTGYVPVEQVSAALLSTDVVVLPYRDGISFRRGSLHAALAHGCSIVSTAPCVPLPELHEGENVLLVPADDAEALSQAVVRLARDRELRERIGVGARELAQQFAWERIARRTVDEVFVPLLKERHLGGLPPV